jgi:hypothetical protein
VHHECEDENYEYQTFLGIFTTVEKAKSAVNLIKKDPDFIEFQDGFLIEKIIINERYWTEGFDTYRLKN